MLQCKIYWKIRLNVAVSRILLFFVLTLCQRSCIAILHLPKKCFNVVHSSIQFLLFPSSLWTFVRKSEPISALLIATSQVPTRSGSLGSLSKKMRKWDPWKHVARLWKRPQTQEGETSWSEQVEPCPYAVPPILSLGPFCADSACSPCVFAS